MNELSQQIAQLIQESRQGTLRQINFVMVHTYYEIGRCIVTFLQNGRERADYGSHLLSVVSTDLTKLLGRGYSQDNLENMRRFYLAYSISETVSRKLDENESALQKALDQPIFSLSWSHYLFLMRVDNLQERRFYEIEAAQNNWSLRELRRNFDTSLYERLALSRDKDGVRALAERGQIIEQPQDLLKEPYILEFLGLDEKSRYSEKKLEAAIINKIEYFLLELGKGFTFVARQHRITFDEEHFWVDLVFYNRILRRFVLIDLKIGKLTPQDLGQMQLYVNYYDRYVKLDEEEKTIGIVLCKSKNQTMVEITLPTDNDQIFAQKYQTIIPSKEEFIHVLNASI